MIIYAIKIEDVKLASLLNFVKFLCSPMSKTEIHLSIRGPYKIKIPNKKLNELDELIKGVPIKIEHVGNFFIYGQNTVYLRCASYAIHKVWDKIEYGYVPHLTLYDGDDEEFAAELFDLLKELHLDIDFKASNIILYDTSKLTASTLLKIGINSGIVNEVIGSNWQLIEPSGFTTREKLELIKLCFLEILNHSVQDRLALV